MKILSTKALLGTAVSFALLSTANVASAADLDNLSDDDLLARIERLEKIIGPGKKYAVRSGTDKVRVTVNGQINTAARYVNDGDDQGVQFVDNDASSSRFRILGQAKLNDRFSLKTNIELDIETNLSSRIDLDNQDDGEEVNGGAGSPNFDFRKVEVVFIDKVFGSLSLGQGQTASDAVFEQDLSGTSVVRDGTQDDSGLDFRLSGGGAAGFSVGQIFPAFDGLSRNNRVRYDTAKFAGFQLSGSVQTEGTYDAAISYANKDLAGFAVKAKASYFVNNGDNARTEDPDRQTRAAGSLSVLHKNSGLSLTGAIGGLLSPQENGGSTPVSADALAWFVRGGWQGNITDLGKTAISASYYNAENSTGAATQAGVTNFDGDWFDVNLVQKIDGLSAELYLSYIRFDADITGAAAVSTQAIDVVYAGTRVKF
ncbi:MAG: porin [Hyphomicrobiales bacterium]